MNDFTYVELGFVAQIAPRAPEFAGLSDVAHARIAALTLVDENVTRDPAGGGGNLVSFDPDLATPREWSALHRALVAQVAPLACGLNLAGLQLSAGRLRALTPLPDDRASPRYLLVASGLYSAMHVGEPDTRQLARSVSHRRGTVARRRRETAALRQVRVPVSKAFALARLTAANACPDVSMGQHRARFVADVFGIRIGATLNYLHDAGVDVSATVERVLGVSA